jgi:hypothetical protein
MNKSCRFVAWMLLPLPAVVGAAASDPFPSPSLPPAFEKRASSSLLFDAADRQSALSEQVQARNDGQSRIFSGGPRLHFGALPDNLALLDPLGPMLNEHSRRFLSSAEFEKKIGRAVGIVTIGILRENRPRHLDRHDPLVELLLVDEARAQRRPGAGSGLRAGRSWRSARRDHTRYAGPGRSPASATAPSARRCACGSARCRAAQCSSKLRMPSASRRALCRKLWAIIGLNTFSSKLPWRRRR